jgi:hypothetical protein
MKLSAGGVGASAKLQIFNAHPALYWGARSRFDDPLQSWAADGRG